MITIIPALEVMKSVTDNNIKGKPAEYRNKAFQIANELIAEANVDVLMPKQLFEMISPRLNDDHKSAFCSLYRIDRSTSNSVDFNIHKSINFLASVESKARSVIILSENTSTYHSNNSIKTINPEDFIGLVNIARSLKRRGVITSLDDGLFFIFFKNGSF